MVMIDCYYVYFRSQVKEKCYYFPVQRWALPEFHYLIRVNDTCLRVDDPYEEQRQYEIGEARVQYDYNPDGGPGLPAQVCVTGYRLQLGSSIDHSLYRL